MASRGGFHSRRREGLEEANAGFFVVATGQVESAEFPGADNLYCRYAFSFGTDWQIMHGVESGLSQIARRAGGGPDPSVCWNFPIDIAFKTTNAHGWPRLSISVYGVDQLGRDVVYGYGSCVLPTSPGSHSRAVQMYAPVPSSLWQQFMSWVSGTYAEFYDAKFVARGEHREVTRVRSTGVVRLQLNILTKGMGAFGYTTTGVGGGAVAAGGGEDGTPFAISSSANLLGGGAGMPLNYSQASLGASGVGN